MAAAQLQRGLAGPAAALLALLALLEPLACSGMPHYGQPPCQAGEVQGEVLGASGHLCAPRCDETSYSCPMNVPPGSAARPQCMLQDIGRRTYCALLCQVDSQCPSGARCQRLKQVDVGVCLFPVSFYDWARGAPSTKLAVGWPSGAGGQPAARALISNTFAALQSMKQKYSIDDGDADLAILKELITSIGTAAPSVPLAPAVVHAAAPAPVPAGVLPSVRAPAPAQSSGEGTAWGAWSADVNRFERDWSRGLPGIEDELESVVWNVEHISNRNAAAGLLRGLILFGLAYLAVGCFVKFYFVGARGMEMIPHITFWTEYPKLVADGVTYSKMIVDDLMGRPQKPSLDGGLHGSLPSVPRGGIGAFEPL